MPNNNLKFIVSHLSARRQYDVAKILYNNNLLDMLFTDGYYNPDKIKLFKILDKILPKKVSNIYKSYQIGFNDKYVCWDWPLALKFKSKLFINGEGNYLAKIEANQYLTEKAIKYSKNKSILNSYYGFDGASLEFFHWGSKRNWNLFLEQCGAPRGITINMHNNFESKLKLNESKKIKECLVMQSRERQEWNLANKIIVPSNFVYNSIINEGADPNKVFLVNYGYDSKLPESFITENSKRKLEQPNKKIKVLFCGNAGFRKGIHDLFAIAQKFKNELVEFRIVGNIESRCLSYLNSIAVNNNIKLLGKMNSIEIQEEYLNADIFFLPSYIEGSAMVNFEAMSMGLPIITTHEAGSVITNAEDGFLHSAGDLQAMEDTLYQLLKSPILRFKIGTSAKRTLSKYSIKTYEENLLNVINIPIK